MFPINFFHNNSTRTEKGNFPFSYNVPLTLHNLPKVNEVMKNFISTLLFVSLIVYFHQVKESKAKKKCDGEF